MKNILLLVHDDAGQEARLQVALDVTRAVGGHLECLEVLHLPIMVMGTFADGAEAIALAELQRAQRELRAQIEQRLAEEDVPWSFGQSYDRPVDALANGADLADLIVLSARLEDGGGVAEARLQPLPLKAARPLLAVSPAARGLALDKPAMVAWDGSGPSVEALRAAVPLLRHAASVVVVEIDPRPGTMPIEDIATYLSRHGIVPELVERRSNEATIAATLCDHVRAIDAGFLVMGAYGTGRIAQAIFGGVTRTMLASSPVPLLLAH